ncbi:N-carbamoylputrescine amidase [Oceanibaculum pacificum]|uniref:N-carbamoylputrescine amidase n=1 Tax=Oceanibaculum pacificum TaxID=580166 RepID=A0A154W4E7_9PROT|nr:N-carbamoylputrescine amidase [Oceanibaculum pacificum]KZD08327.1 N-carbamoylputrescine amidase [Oceanibaculum pacificum]
MTEVTLAATQMACSWDKAANVARAEALVREAAGRGANVILIQELFETPYFCVDQKLELFRLASPIAENETVKRMQTLAVELGVVLPVSVFERANNAYYNSIVILDADGANLGVYRKSHIPDGPGYQEKFYFNPGDTGFKVFDTRFGKLGCAICWDQWFPESARAMALMGADFLFYPTAIGSEPQDASLDSMEHWRTTMRGHAAANMMPLLASNRIGREEGDAAGITFYGSSFIADHKGQLVAEANRTDETVLTARFDLDRIRAERAGWGFFRDRRPELYGPLMTLDGQTRR